MSNQNDDEEQVTIDFAEYQALQSEIADAHAMLDRFGVTGIAHSLASRIETMMLLGCAGNLKVDQEFNELFNGYYPDLAIDLSTKLAKENND